MDGLLKDHLNDDDLKNFFNAVLHAFKTLNLERQKKFVATLIRAASGYVRSPYTCVAYLSCHEDFDLRQLAIQNCFLNYCHLRAPSQHSSITASTSPDGAG